MATPYTVRIASGDQFDHVYDVGQWPTGANINDPNQFAINETFYDPVAAATRANAFNRGVTPPPPWSPLTSGGTKPPAKGAHR